MFLLVPLFLALAIGGAIYGWVRHRERADAMEKLADRLGVEYHPNGVGGVSRHASFLERLFSSAGAGTPIPDADPFDQGDDRRPYHTLRGAIDVAGTGRDLWAGDWKYETGSGKNRSTHRFSYVALAAPEHGPRVRVRPESVLDTAAATLGFNDLDFESLEFSDAYHVTADDERYAYALFHPAMIEFFLENRPPRVRVGDGWVVVYGEQRWPPGDFERHVAIAARIVALWPRHLLAG